MTRQYFIVPAIALLLLTKTSLSQIPDKPFDIYVGVGLSLPASHYNDLTENYNTGFHGMGGIGFNINSYVEAVLKLEYHSLSRNWINTAPPNATGGTLQAMFGGADLRLSPKSEGSPVLPFLFGGMGVAIFSVSELSGIAALTFVPENNSKIYFDIGAGLEIITGDDMTFFVQGSYVSVVFDDENRAFVPITLGLKF